MRVQDRFGDYGLVGIYCLNPAENRLEQFVFSCRILHLGVEQFTYAQLGFPTLEVQGDVATTLNQTEKPDLDCPANGFCHADPENGSRRPPTSFGCC